MEFPVNACQRLNALSSNHPQKTTNTVSDCIRFDVIKTAIEIIFY